MSRAQPSAGLADTLSMGYRIVISASLSIVFGALLGCTKPNPNACCTTPTQCTKVGLDDIKQCSGVNVCSPDGDCVAPQCTANTDCAGSNDLCVSNQCVAQTCLGSNGWTVCFTDVPTGVKQLPSSLDTSESSPDCSPAPTSWASNGQIDACFVLADTIEVQQTVTVTGTRPLVLAGMTAIDIEGRLEASSTTHLGIRGPGSPSPHCKPANRDATSFNSIGGGGAGGVFGAVAGYGGQAGGGPTTGGNPPGYDESQPSRLRAGCDGYPGAAGTAPSGPPGGGGGAVYLVSGGSIRIAGIINASGGGAKAGGAQAGGSGGGSGGMIVLFAPSINASGGTVLAVAGGGASGAGAATVAGAGSDPDPRQPNATTPGGMTSSPGGNGGDGYTPGDRAGVPGYAGNNGGGGGGGGGSIGFIQSNVALDGATVWPPPGGVQ